MKNIYTFHATLPNQVRQLRTTGVINKIMGKYVYLTKPPWAIFGMVGDGSMTQSTVYISVLKQTTMIRIKNQDILCFARVCEILLCSSPGLKGTLSLKLKAFPLQSVAIFFLSGWMSGSRIWLYVATLTFLGCDCLTVWENISVASRQPEQQHLSTEPAEDF